MLHDTLYLHDSHPIQSKRSYSPSTALARFLGAMTDKELLLHNEVIKVKGLVRKHDVIITKDDYYCWKVVVKKHSETRLYFNLNEATKVSEVESLLLGTVHEVLLKYGNSIHSSLKEIEKLLK